MYYSFLLLHNLAAKCGKKSDYMHEDRESEWKFLEQGPTGEGAFFVFYFSFHQGFKVICHALIKKTS